MVAIYFLPHSKYNLNGPSSTCFLARSSRACVFICCTSSESNRRRRTNRSWLPMHSWRICTNHKARRQQSAPPHRELRGFRRSRSALTHQLVDSLPRGVELEDVCFLVEWFDGELSRADTNKPSIRPFTINADGQIGGAPSALALYRFNFPRAAHGNRKPIFQSVSQSAHLVKHLHKQREGKTRKESQL